MPCEGSTARAATVVKNEIVSHPASRSRPHSSDPVFNRRGVVEAAGVEPVPAHFLTGDGARLPRILAVNLLPCPGFESPGVPPSRGDIWETGSWSPLPPRTERRGPVESGLSLPFLRAPQELLAFRSPAVASRERCPSRSICGRLVETRVAPEDHKGRIGGLMRNDAPQEEEVLRRITVDPRIFGGKPIIRGAGWLWSMSWHARRGG